VEVLSSDSDSSEYEPDTSDSESEWADGESLCELEGDAACIDALEENLASLKAEVDALCDCTFEMLKENMPQALASVELRMLISRDLGQKTLSLRFGSSVQQRISHTDAFQKQ
jgi:hypothetical protein